jgi:head-tail adaptor
MATKTISAGDLKHKVVFKQPNSSLNDEAGEVRTYTAQVTTWAYVTAYKEHRDTDAASTVLARALDFYVRYSAANSAITKDWLIEYKADDYVIHQIELIEQDKNFLRFTGKVRE